MNDILGPFGTTLFVLVFGLIVLAGAMFAGGRPTDLPKVGGKALVIGGLILIAIVMLLAWRVSQVPEGIG